MMNTYGSATTSDSATIGATTTKVLDANPNRTYFSIQNVSDEDVFLGFGVAAVMNKGLKLRVNATYEMTLDANPCVGQINAICASGSKTVLVTEA